MQKIFFFILLISINPFVFSQRTKECGTEHSAANRQFYISKLDMIKQNNLRPTASVYYVKVFIHDFIANDGSDSAWSRAEVNSEFAATAAQYKPYGICLILAGVDFPRNTAFMNSMDKSQFGSIYPSIKHDYAIDISLHKNLTDGASTLNGTAYSIPSVINSLSRGAIGKFSMAHELGHSLGLYHTFETQFGLECPDGSNGTTAGDLMADTRATPDADAYMGNNTTTGCVYTGSLTISCNNSSQLYNPEVTNIMCYGSRVCRNIFSPNQVAYMKLLLETSPFMTPIWTEATGNYSDATTSPNFSFYSSDTTIANANIYIGNIFNGSGPSILMIGAVVQKYLAKNSIFLMPGVQVSASNGSNNRGYIEFKVGEICDMTHPY